MDIELGSLTPQERVALVVLAKAMALADGELTHDERVALSGLAAEVGPEAFHAADKVKLGDRQSTRDFLGTIERQDARERIYDVLLTLAREDGLASEEAPLLDLVAQAWDIVVVGGHDPGA